MISMGGALDNFHLLSRYMFVCVYECECACLNPMPKWLPTAHAISLIFSIKNSLDFILRFKASTKNGEFSIEITNTTTDAIGIYDRDHLTAKK